MGESVDGAYITLELTTQRWTSIKLVGAELTCEGDCRAQVPLDKVAWLFEQVPDLHTLETRRLMAVVELSAGWAAGWGSSEQ